MEEMARKMEQMERRMSAMEAKEKKRKEEMIAIKSLYQEELSYLRREHLKFQTELSGLENDIEDLRGRMERDTNNMGGAGVSAKTIASLTEKTERLETLQRVLNRFHVGLQSRKDLEMEIKSIKRDVAYILKNNQGVGNNQQRQENDEEDDENIDEKTELEERDCGIHSSNDRSKKNPVTVPKQRSSIQKRDTATQRIEYGEKSSIGFKKYVMTSDERKPDSFRKTNDEIPYLKKRTAYGERSKNYYETSTMAFDERPDKQDFPKHELIVDELYIDASTQKSKKTMECVQERREKAEAEERKRKEMQEKQSPLGIALARGIHSWLQGNKK